jgi:hypothetical protein
MKERSIQEFADKQGLKRRIIHSPGALDSWKKEAAKLTDRKATEIEGFLIALFDAWIDNSRLNNRWAVPEGNLNKDKKFFAVKRIPIRAYFWYSDAQKNTIVISHYVYKKWQKLRTEDVRKVKMNWESENAGKSK